MGSKPSVIPAKGGISLRIVVSLYTVRYHRGAKRRRGDS